MAQHYVPGARDPEKRFDVVRCVSRTRLDPRLDLQKHSSDFGWGYGGSGPAQLALAICADYTGDDALALRVYQHFKFRVIAGLPQGKAWVLNRYDVELGLLDLFPTDWV